MVIGIRQTKIQIQASSFNSGANLLKFLRCLTSSSLICEMFTIGLLWVFKPYIYYLAHGGNDVTSAFTNHHKMCWANSVALQLIKPGYTACI